MDYLNSSENEILVELSKLAEDLLMIDDKDLRLVLVSRTKDLVKLLSSLKSDNMIPWFNRKKWFEMCGFVDV